MIKEKSFWVRNRQTGKPQLVEGKLIPEDEDAWCPGDLRLHTADKQCYPHFFTSPEELIEFEIEMAQHAIEFETEMFQSQLEELKAEKQHWEDMLKVYKIKARST
jgi:hypothetical protein